MCESAAKRQSRANDDFRFCRKLEQRAVGETRLRIRKGPPLIAYRYRSVSSEFLFIGGAAKESFSHKDTHLLASLI